MEGRGRKSLASVTVLPTPMVSRMESPADLNDRQKALWLEMVETKPAEWFTADNAPLLAEYVRAVDMCNVLAQGIEAELAGQNENGPGLKDLLSMRDREAKRATSLATKLRLTNQSRYTPQASATANRKTPPVMRTPWAFGKK